MTKIENSIRNLEIINDQYKRYENEMDLNWANLN